MFNMLCSKLAWIPLSRWHTHQIVREEFEITSSYDHTRQDSSLIVLAGCKLIPVLSLSFLGRAGGRGGSDNCSSSRAQISFKTQALLKIL